MCSNEETSQNKHSCSNSAESEEVEAKILNEQEQVQVREKQPDESEHADLIEETQIMSDLADYMNRIKDNYRLKHIDNDKEPRTDFSLSLQLFYRVYTWVVCYEEIRELDR